jgi:hypothetical protein
MAISGIVSIHPLIVKLLRPKHRVLRWFWQAASVSLAAQLATAPLVIYYFHQLPVYSLITSLIAIPLLSILMALFMASIPLFAAGILEGFSSFLLLSLARLMNGSMEYLADVPNKRRVRRHYRCKSVGGSAIRAVECLDDEEGIVHVDGEDYFAYLERLFGTRKGPAWPGRGRGGRTYRGCRYRQLRRAVDDPEPLAAIDRSQTSQRLTLRQRRTGKG